MIRLSRAQVREVDRRAVEEYGIPSIVLMENASRAVADAVWDELANRSGKRVTILCGGGNNGGDGLAAARHLHNRGAHVTVGLYADPARYRGDALTNWQIVQAMRLPTFDVTPDAVRATLADCLVDALFGTGLTEPPREPFADVARAVATTGIPVIAVDLPSGLDCDTGQPLDHAIHATRTVTFVAEKRGFQNPASRPLTGPITVADIGCPRELVDAIVGLASRGG